jgi:hypothetical protein
MDSFATDQKGGNSGDSRRNYTDKSLLALIEGECDAAFSHARI